MCLVHFVVHAWLAGFPSRECVNDDLSKSERQREEARLRMKRRANYIAWFGGKRPPVGQFCKFVQYKSLAGFDL
jgi:hypothetical protein